MGLIKPRAFIPFFISIILFISPVLTAQTHGPAGSLASELQRLDAIIQDTKAGGDAKRGALNEKARLLEMTGNIEEAAQTWNQAAFAEQGKRDDDALLRSAACFAAMGEYAKADANVKTVLLTGRDAGNLRDARYLAAQIEVLRDGEKGFPVLFAFLDNPEYVSFYPGAYYLLWKISGSDNYKTKLISGFPKSPEALLAQGTNAGITSAPTPMWIFFPGREQITLTTPEKTSLAEVPANARTEEKKPENDTPVLIQVGLYGQQENAKAMVDRLKAKGFTGTTSQKQVSGNTYWQVTVLPGSNPNQTILRLKDAGFESFPVFQE